MPTLTTDSGTLQVIGSSAGLLKHSVLGAEIGAWTVADTIRLNHLNYDLSNVELSNIAPFLLPNAVHYDTLTAFDMGPRARRDVSEGIYARGWRLRISGGDCLLARASDDNLAWTDEFREFVYPGNETWWFDLTFDQNGRPFVCWEYQDTIWLYYYDPVEEEMTTRELCSGRTPRAKLDVRRRRLIDQSDIILFYINDTEDQVEYRLQRDRYNTAYATNITGVSDTYLELLFMANNYRLYLYFVEYDSGSDTYSMGYWHSAPYPYVIDSFMYIEGDMPITAEKRYRHPIIEYAFVTNDTIIEGQRNVVFKETEITEESAVIEGDTILFAATEEFPEDTFIVEETESEEVFVTGDSVITGSKEQVIIEVEIDDEEMTVANDSIRSASTA